MGMVYKRKKKDKDGNVKELSVYWIKYYRNGKPYRESSHSKKHSEALRLLKKREGEISGGKLPGIYFDRVTFDELAEDFLRDYRVNERKSIKTAELSVRCLEECFAGLRVTQITTPLVEAYVEHRLDEGMANATVNRELRALKRMLNLGVQRTPPKVDRVPYIAELKTNNTRKGFFEHGDYLSLRSALPSHLYGFVTFGYKTGWRISEIAGLTWSQVDLKQGIVRLEPEETKNDEARTVYLDDELRGIFVRQWNTRKEAAKVLPYVFLNEHGADKIKRFDKAWKTACKDAGIGVRLFHDFRRTALRNMVRSGVPERVAMMISGHKTRSVFDRYNIVSDTDLRLAAQKQEAYLEAQMGTPTSTPANLEAESTKVKSLNLQE